MIVKKANENYILCIYNRDLNKVTEEDAYPMKNVYRVLEKVAFMRILITETSRKYTTYSVQGAGLYQFKRMPFGLVNSPKTFTRLIDALFGSEYDPNFFCIFR